jgi:[ribosomal protein S5]-alanine N-acetyltransferase
VAAQVIAMNLVAITPRLAESPAVRKSQLLSQVCDMTVAIYPGGRPVMPWSGYLVQENGVYIGACGFKTPPDDGAVEIAYFTFPEHEGRGVATQVARLLVDLAFRNGVRLVRAQTLPAQNASTAILTKLGFSKMGTVSHPEDGLVWEWQRMC